MHILSNDVIRAVGWTLIHSLWQGLVLALIAGILILLTRKAKPVLRYNIFTGLFFLFVCSAVVTFFYEYNKLQVSPVAAVPVSVVHVTATPAPVTGPVAITPQAPPFSARFINYFNQHAPLLVMLWFIVFVARLLWLFGGLVYVQRIRHYKTSMPDALLVQTLEELAGRLRLGRPVQLLESAMVKVPTALGMLKPVILIPLGMMAQLPPEQLEAVLLHELAHIRRRDFLVNLLQHFAETVFFFNPALLWLSARIRDEREHCCDDMAITVIQDRTGYIQALVSFQEYQLANTSSYAMAFPGKKNQLLHRVKRILDSRNKTLNLAEKSFLLICFSLIGMLGVVFSQSEKQPEQTQLTVKVIKKAEQRTNQAPDERAPLKIIPASPEVVRDTVRIISDPGNVDYNNLDGVTEGTTLKFERDRNGQPYTVYLFKRDGMVYQAEMDHDNEILRFKANGKEIFRKGDSKQQLWPYAGAMQTLYTDYKLPHQKDYTAYQPNYQPYQPTYPSRNDSVPVLRRGSLVLTGVITTDYEGVPYKITVATNKAAGLEIDGVKVPEEQLPSRYPLINNIFRKLEADNEAAVQERVHSEAQRAADEKKREAAEQKRELAYREQLQLNSPKLSPVAPLSPASSPAKLSPTAPLPPVPPSPDLAGKILEDLLKDGIITQKDKVNFRLNKNEFIVNDQPQPATVREKYQRKYVKGRADSYTFSKDGNHASSHTNTANK